VSNFLQKFRKVFIAQGAPPVSTTPAANEKMFNREKFLNIVFGHY
jgi:hypothetical protein